MILSNNKGESCTVEALVSDHLRNFRKVVATRAGRLQELLT